MALHFLGLNLSRPYHYVTLLATRDRVYKKRISMAVVEAPLYTVNMYAGYNKVP